MHKMQNDIETVHIGIVLCVWKQVLLVLI